MAKLYDYRVDIDLRLKQGESLTFKGVKYNPPRITIYLIADPNIPFQYDYYYRIKIQYASGQEHLPLADKIYLHVSKSNLGLSRSGLIEDLFPVGEDNPESKSEAESLLEDIIDDLSGENSTNFEDLVFYNDSDSYWFLTNINPPLPVPPEPDPIEEEVPVYIVKSSVPGGLKGQIYFEFRELNGQRELGGVGELNQDTYNTEEVIFSSVGESSTDFNYRGMGDSILQQLNNQITEIDGVGEFGVLSIVETQTEPPQNFYDYTIVGKVVDGGTKTPLGNVYITDDVKSVGLIGSNINSEPSGDFILNGEYQKDNTFKITFSLDGYQEKIITPFSYSQTGISTIKTDLGIIELLSTLPDKKTVIEESSLPDAEVKAVAVKEKLKDPMGFAQSEMLQKLIRTAKTVLLPAVLALIAKFGIAKAKEMLGKKLEDIDFTCPGDLEELKKIIEKKNNLTKILNNIFNSLNTIKTGVEVADKIISISNIVVNVLSGLIVAFPTIPFAPSPTAPLTTKLPSKDGPKDVIEKIAEILGKMKILSSSVLLVLNILIGILQEILSYLALLDMLLQECANNSLLQNQESISNDLLKATQQQALQGNPVITNVNGFEMAVIPVKGTTNDQIQRRRAIARNQAGIIMLQGEPSFSSNDQILINELIFYIKQNDLKAD